MASAPDPELTVKWVLFGFQGRIGRKSYFLAALLIVLIQAAVIAKIASYPEDDPALAFWGLVLIAVWIASAWAGLALAVKRLHDLGRPGIFAIFLLIPAVAFIAFVLLAVLPGTGQTNEHGPPPFPRDPA